MSSVQKVGQFTFPDFSGTRCLMMPFIQGDPESVPDIYRGYSDIISTVYLDRGDVGYLTIDEAWVDKDTPHRGQRAKWDRALHTEAGIDATKQPRWGHWGGRPNVTLDRQVRILLANNLDHSCAIWNAEHPDTSIDGDIGDCADQYPYEDATLALAGEVYEIGIFTPHESLKVRQGVRRQFLRIVGSGVNGKEPYFTKNPVMPHL